MTKHTNIYVQVNLGEFSCISEKAENEANEVSDILYFKYLQYNFSAGIRYDFGKKREISFNNDINSEA